MKRNTLIIVGSILLLALGGFLFYNQFPKKLTIGEIVRENSFTQGAEFSVHKIENGKVVALPISDDKQYELVTIFEELKLIKSDQLYPVLDADYIIAPKTNYSQKVYVFLEGNVIVFSEKTSNGYVIQNKKFTKSIKQIID